jgi:arylsulfatase A-like enzyme
MSIARDPAAIEHRSVLYDSEIASVDHQLDRLIASARKVAGERDLWIIVTADHGESFGEHGIFFIRDLYEPTLRVPLIIQPPRHISATPVVRTLVGLADVAPTVQEIMGLPVDDSLDGRSLLGGVLGAPLPDRSQQAVIAFASSGPDFIRSSSIRSTRYRAIHRGAGLPRHGIAHQWIPEVHELYDLTTDPEELHNLADEQGVIYKELTSSLPTKIEAVSADVSKDQLEMLKALGYAK